MVTVVEFVHVFFTTPACIRYGVFLPKLTKDHYRVYLFQNKGNSFKTGFLDFYRYFIMQCEYIQARDYCNGVIVVTDYTEANIIETVKWLNMVDVRDIFMIMREGYGMRIKGFHVLSESGTINLLIQIFKQALSKKVAERIRVHKNADTILEVIGKEIMPMDYGGNEKPVHELHKKYQDVLASSEFTKYLNDMRRTCTNENLRLTEKYSHSTLGLPGAFRSLNVD